MNPINTDVAFIFKHKLFKNSFIYIVPNVIGLAIPFFLLPVLTRYLTPSDYGIISIFRILVAMFVVFVGLNMRGAIFVNFFKINKENLREYIGNVIFITFISFILTFIIIYILKKPLSHLFKFPENWLPIVVIVALAQSIFTLALTLWQVEQKALPYGLFQILQTIINVSLSLFFVVALGWRWQGRLYGIIITYVVFGIISFFVIYKRRYIKFSFNKNYMGIDRIFINSMVSISATGIYTVGYQIGMIISLLVSSFNKAWSPFLFEKLKEDNFLTKIKIVKFTYLYSAGIIIMALALSFIAPYFLRFFVHKSFYSAYKYVLWIALGYAATGMYYMVTNYIIYAKKTYILAWITFFSACINIILNYFMIKANGAIGAAQATTITFFLSFILTWILSAKVYKMPWLLKKEAHYGSN